jgi:hypothetical protein
VVGVAIQTTLSRGLGCHSVRKPSK